MHSNDHKRFVRLVFVGFFCSVGDFSVKHVQPPNIDNITFYEKYQSSISTNPAYRDENPFGGWYTDVNSTSSFQLFVKMALPDLI